MEKLVLGVFEFPEQVRKAVDDLNETGFGNENISIVMKETQEARKYLENRGSQVIDSTVGGAATGSVVGSIAGLLIGVGTIIVPGGFLVGGPVALALGLTGVAATTAGGLVTGAFTGGLIGALVGLGVSEDYAKDYEAKINKGEILVGVTSREATEDYVKDVLITQGGKNVTSTAKPASGTQMQEPRFGVAIPHDIGRSKAQNSEEKDG